MRTPKTPETDAIVAAVAERLGVDRFVVETAWLCAAGYFGSEGADVEVEVASTDRINSLASDWIADSLIEANNDEMAAFDDL